MSILSRFRQTRLAPENKIIVPPEIKMADPITPLPETPEPVTIIERVQICVKCGVEGAEHQFTNGDLYLKRLEHNYLCETCWTAREAARTRHNIANTNTLVVGKPLRMKKVETKAEAEQA